MKKKIAWVVVSCLMTAALVLASCAPAPTHTTNTTNNTTTNNNTNARKGGDGEAQFEEARWNASGKVGRSAKVWWDACRGSKRSGYLVG